MLWGIYHYNDSRTVATADLLAMGRAINRNGQGGEAIKSLGSVGMGHLPLRPPAYVKNYLLANEDETIFLAFDGFISNYDILSKQSIKQKHQFGISARSPEIIIHLYEEYGLKCFEMLNGMFALALWDGRTRELILARDRYGIKPLYYYDNGQSLIFSSQIKPILSFGIVEQKTDPQAFYDYLSLNYVPFGKTIFQYINKVPIRGYLKYSKENRTAEHYWDFKVEPELKAQETEIEEELGRRLRQAVGNLFTSERPAGVFLSGGLDSAAIAYYLKELAQDTIDTFGVSFRQKGYDESGYGKMVADFLGTNHHIVAMGDEFVKDYERIINCYENLHAEVSMIPFYYLAQAAGKDKDCMLCGESGDELLGGYPEMVADRILTRYKKIPLPIRSFLIRPVVEMLPVSDAPVSFDYKAKHFIRGAQYPPLRAHYYWREVFTEDEKKALLNKDFYASGQYQETFDRYAHSISHYCCSDMLKGFELGYLNTLIPDNNLPYYDTLCAAHSIDARYPFLDNDLVDFALKIPVSMKIKGMTTKYLLRKILKDKIPQAIISRKKHGLSCPVKIWIREEMKDIFADRLSPANLKQHPYLNAEYVQRLIKEHLDRKADNSRKIWSLFCFVVWHKGHIGG